MHFAHNIADIFPVCEFVAKLAECTCYICEKRSSAFGIRYFFAEGLFMRKSRWSVALLVLIVVAFCLIACNKETKPATFTISFDTGGSAPISVVEGEEAPAIEEPQKEGYIFDGWYTDENLQEEFVATQPITQNIVLYAKWKSVYAETDSSKLEFALTSDEKSYIVTGIGTFGGTELSIPATYNSKSVTAIGDSAFRDCSAIKSITIPSSVTSIGTTVFYGCTSLESITVNSENKTYSSNGNCLIKTSDKELIAGCKASVIPSDGSVTSIGSQAFAGCGSLEQIAIPNNVKSVGESAFWRCSALKQITISSSVTSIGSSAFKECIALENITIPSSVTSIGAYAFYKCKLLDSITVGDGVTSIGEGAFGYCGRLENVVFGSASKLSTIGYRVFEDCVSLASISLPRSLTSIGYQAFSDCTNLQTVSFGETESASSSLKTLGYKVFEGCSRLNDISLPSGLTSLGDCAFYDCVALESINIPSGITSIGYGVFYGCNKLKSVSIPKAVTLISTSAFEGCSALAAVTFEDGSALTSIGFKAFSGCTSLKDITIPSSVTSIRQYAFDKCTKLETITFANTATWYRTTKSSDWTDKKNGTNTDVSDKEQNATYFTSEYIDYYWYKA